MGGQGQGPFGPWRCHLSPRSPKPWEPMSLMIVYAWSPVPLGVPSGFRAGWISGGASLSWRAGPLLPPAGLASALLHRVGAKQGSEGAIGWGATTLHLEVGSQGSVLAGAPLRGGQGIWKEKRVGLGSTQRYFCFRSPVSIRCSVSRQDRAFYSSCIHSHSFAHAFIHSFTHSFILQ